ncbi:hypothetical protein PENANT_c012G11404 [Penicillium antarcticum]|uniref:alpha-amylase n=1 Tax=Penicillium antarcticum TaxID=416450 RepID=A0A1V6Q6P5_9EURO|nr:hypothetical protein PENANT_c012G11404 [Penicillium antarcticum]
MSFLLALLGLVSLTSAASTADWKPRAVYQTMTDRFARTDNSTTSPCSTKDGLYCGGTWRGTINQLDYIEGMGFDAVMISPIIDNIKGRVSYGEAYHGYWPVNLNALNARFGTHQDLLDLSDALHARGMYLMMDTVINNMAQIIPNGTDPAKEVDYSVFDPFNNKDYFHPYCKIKDWNNFTDAQLCQTGDLNVPLPDLYTEHPDVQKLLIDWAKDAIKTYSIDGLRIDAAKHVDANFLKTFTNDIGVFSTGEVLEGAVSIISDYQAHYIGSMPNYPIYFQMLQAFTMGNTSALALEVEAMKQACTDVNALVSFSENHDKPRIGSMSNDTVTAKNVLVFTLLFDGIPMIYQGQEQHLKGADPPYDREAIWLTKYNTESELYQLIAKLNKLRKHVNALGSDYFDQPTHTVYQGASELAFSKGVEGRQVIMMLSTQGSESGAYNVALSNSYNAGTEIMEILNCEKYTPDEFGSITVAMNKGEPRVFWPVKYMEGSGLCGYEIKNVTLAQLKNGVASSASSVIASSPLTTALASLCLALTSIVMIL